jgi:hypothetical protein
MHNPTLPPYKIDLSNILLLLSFLLILLAVNGIAIYNNETNISKYANIA